MKFEGLEKREEQFEQLELSVVFFSYLKSV